MSPAVYESDDTLSDGGDWLQEPGFHKPDVESLRRGIPIVPGVQVGILLVSFLISTGSHFAYLLVHVHLN